MTGTMAVTKKTPARPVGTSAEDLIALLQHGPTGLCFAENAFEPIKRELSTVTSNAHLLSCIIQYLMLAQYLDERRGSPKAAEQVLALANCAISTLASRTAEDLRIDELHALANAQRRSLEIGSAMLGAFEPQSQGSRGRPKGR